MRVGMGLTRDEEIDYAIERGIEIPITKASPYSIDANLWGRSIEAGVLEDPWVAPPADVYQWTVDPARGAPTRSRSTIAFEGGIPVALDGERLGPGGARRAADEARRARTAWAASTTSRTASSASRAARSTRRPRRRCCIRAHRALEGLDAVQGHAALQPARRRRAGAAHLRRALVQRAAPRPAAATRVVAARRLRRGADAARPRQRGRRRAAVAAVAVRQEPRDLRQGRRVRSCRGRRVHRDLRAAAAHRGGAPAVPSARITARRGHGPTRSSRRSRSPSLIRSRRPSAEAPARAFGPRWDWYAPAAPRRCRRMPGTGILRDQGNDDALRELS